jgi:prolipoprotein diacylglyceryltransferase
MLQILVDFGTRHVLGWGIPLRIYGYGLMLVLGFLVAIYVGQWRARRMGENPEHVARIGLLSLIGGILGARAAYIIQWWDSPQFRDAANPIGAVLDVTSGGLTYYGGVILGTAMVVTYLMLKHLPARRYLDIVAVPLMIGLAFGRMGCLLNGCCYGSRCDPHWALAMTFPMFSKPLVKVDGRSNPYSQDTQGPSPIYSHQLSKGQITPPEPLVDETRAGKVRVEGEFKDRKFLHAPRYFHGALSNDQTVMWVDDKCKPGAEQAFYALAGPDRLLDEKEWDRGLHTDGGLLQGSEMWDEAITFDHDGSGKLSFDELWEYLTWRRTQFDADGDGKLSPAERAAANRTLQADQFALAGHSHSLAVKPSQALGIANALLLGGLVWAFFRFRKREGQAFALLVVLYPITRFVEESIRDDNPHNLMAGVFTHNQYTSMVLTTIGIGMWLLLRYLPGSAGPAWADRQAAAAPDHRKRKTGRTI